MAILYNLRRIAEVCHEHVDNNFRRLPRNVVDRATPLCGDVASLLESMLDVMDTGDMQRTVQLRRACDKVKDRLSAECRKVHDELRDSAPADMTVLYAYLNMMQEQQELLSSLRKLLRADYKLMSVDTRSITEYEHS